jgi:flagellar basal-body rod protein FlgB
MPEKPLLLSLAARAAGHAAARHAATARNIAHAETPGYRAREVAPFDPAQTGGLALRRTDARHLSASGTAAAPREVRAPADATGNTVVLQDQVLAAVDASRDHGRAVTVYRASLDLLRAAVGGR